MPIKTNIIQGDCLNILSWYPNNYFDLIITSPPYAEQRKNTYGGVKPDEYVEWFLPRSAEFLRALKPDGTFILNIKESAIGGERHTYVIELILALREQGWFWTEEFMWHKRSVMPGKWPNRFRDAWERCLQFNKTKKFNMYQEAVMVPVGWRIKKRMKNLSLKDMERQEMQTGSGFGINRSNWVGRDMVYPTNVLHFATECGNKKHSAVFPEALPKWFIELFTKVGNTVLDPFAGSGTVCKVAQELGRNSIGIEISSEYCEVARERLSQLSLF